MFQNTNFRLKLCIYWFFHTKINSYVINSFPSVKTMKQNHRCQMWLYVHHFLNTFNHSLSVLCYLFTWVQKFSIEIWAKKKICYKTSARIMWIKNQIELVSIHCTKRFCAYQKIVFLFVYWKTRDKKPDR